MRPRAFLLVAVAVAAALAAAQLAGAGPRGTSADLSLTMAATSAAVGAPLTFTITVRNASAHAAGKVVVTDELPSLSRPGSSVPSQGSCNHLRSMRCALGTLGAGAEATVEIILTPFEQGPLQNTASVASATADPNPSNNTATSTATVGPRPGGPPAGSVRIVPHG